jgi:hypothetical protein
MPGFCARSRRVAFLPAVAAALVLVAASSIAAAGFEGAPDSPPKPYSVFVSYAGEADAQLDARLQNAMGALAAGLEEHPALFRLTDSRDTANVRVTIFDAQAATSELRHVGGPAGFIANRVFESRGRDFFSFDAIVRVDGKRKQVKGSGTGATEVGSFRSAATDFVRQLETFAEESYTGFR